MSRMPINRLGGGGVLLVSQAPPLHLASATVPAPATQPVASQFVQAQ